MLAYADLSTQLVLVTNDAASQTRDTLNSLCAEANLVLTSGNLGVVGDKDGFRVFLKDPSEPTEGLICICGLNTDMAALVPAMQTCLSEIAEGAA